MKHIFVQNIQSIMFTEYAALELSAPLLSMLEIVILLFILSCNTEQPKK